ncbi:MAG: sigma-70 family RNA polymerase sigma factor [Planctomycetes bacterium]|nr:sigma-70 family RNA polymerase sigma factor [Planctomycetota bacterium]
MDRFTSTSWTMVTGAAAGSEPARDAFAQRYEPLVRSYLAARWRLGRENEEVRDAAQDVFVECFKAGGALERVERDRPGGFRAYLYGVISNVAAMIERGETRRRRREGGPSIEAERLPANDATLSQVFDRAWTQMVAREARLALAERRREDAAMAERFHCLELRYTEGLPPRVIAERLGLPIETVYERLKRARQDYRDALFAILADYDPRATKAELEERCRQLVSSL